MIGLQDNTWCLSVEMKEASSISEGWQNLTLSHNLAILRGSVLEDVYMMIRKGVNANAPTLAHLAPP